MTSTGPKLRYLYNFSPANGGNTTNAFAQYLLFLCQTYPKQIRPDEVKLTVSMLSKSRLLGGVCMKRLIPSEFGRNAENLSRLAAALSADRTDRLARELNLLGHTAQYCVAAADWKQLATGIWGPERVEVLLSEKRKEAEAEAAR